MFLGWGSGKAGSLLAHVPTERQFQPQANAFFWNAFFWTPIRYSRQPILCDESPLEPPSRLSASGIKRLGAQKTVIPSVGSVSV